MPGVVPHATVYRLYSKILLQQSRLKTPPAQEMTLYIPDKTDPPTDSWNDALGILARRNPPFILKLDYAESGDGRHIVVDSPKRDSMLQDVNTRLKNYQKSGYHDCRPNPRFLIQDFVATPNETFCVHFIVPRDSSSPGVFIGATSQIFDNESHWKGAMIDISRQEELEVLFQHSIQEASTGLRDEGFMVPQAWISSWTKTAIVDVNPRSNRGLYLCLLQTHFSERTEVCDARESSRTGSATELEQSLDEIVCISDLVWLGLCGPVHRIEESSGRVVLGAPIVELLDELHERCITLLKS